MPNETHSCGSRLSRINGRTLSAAIRATKANHRFGTFKPTHWVNVCPACDSYALGVETEHPWPFLSPDGVMLTVNDFAPEVRSATEVLDFFGFKFSRSALDSAILLARIEFSSTVAVERLASDFLAGRTLDVLLLSERICEWGEGQRVWANLMRLNDRGELQKLLNEWLLGLSNASDEDVIERGAAIPGLGVSFASKHLRMMSPTKFAVLDGVLSEGLGLALNARGYHLFLRCLRDFHTNHSVPSTFAELEAGIFLLVRQGVRST